MRTRTQWGLMFVHVLVDDIAHIVIINIGYDSYYKSVLDGALDMSLIRLCYLRHLIASRVKVFTVTPSSLIAKTENFFSDNCTNQL